MAQHGFLGSQMLSPIDVSYLADTVIVFRYFEAAGEIRKAISVMKKRSGPHESVIRQYTMSGHGIEFGEPLWDFRGVMTGVPVFTGERQAAGGAD